MAKPAKTLIFALFYGFIELHDICNAIGERFQSKEQQMSNVWKRMSDIMSANLNSALDKWGNPQR
jgi:hypothetical protein